MSGAAPRQAWTNHGPLDVVALGEAMIEFNEARAGDSRSWLQGFGGDTSNMAIAAARLGARSGYVTRVGDDAFGRRLMALWAAEGVVTDGVSVDPDASTGVYFVAHGANGHEFSYLRQGSAASRMTPASLPLALLRSTRVLHLSAISQAISNSACDACFAAIDIARAAGARIAYDTNLRLKLWRLPRARAVILETLRRVDWALPGLDDASLLFGELDPAQIVEACHAHGSAVVVLKLGRDGCIVSDRNRNERIEGVRVASVDATGAGDCFDGAFVARMVAGDDAFAAARYANKAAALATVGYGAVAPLPRAADVEALV
ncbi:MAG TPA: sugar kinase [Casimicrobiaceae bacterium]|nr:sugar kinase [Casimicrobiaceae bacterium]